MRLIEGVSESQPGLEVEQWFALKTKAQHEKMVRARLFRLGIEPLLPLMPRLSQWHDRKKMIEVPLFPGYCFAKLTHGKRMTVLQLPGVAYIVGRGGMPEPIPHSEIEGLRRLSGSGLPIEGSGCLSEGDPVEITQGPLAGVKGTLIRRERAAYVVIGVQLLKQGATVKIELDAVRRVDPVSAPTGLPSADRSAEPRSAVAVL